MKLSLRQKNLYLLFLAFVLTVIAPLRALALPASEVMAAAGAGHTCSMAASEISANDQMDCCKVEKECCCSAAPVEPSDLESGVQSNQNAKFIPIKGTARPVISDWLSCSPALMQGLGQSSLSQQALATQRPLYILKRSLLI